MGAQDNIPDRELCRETINIAANLIAEHGWTRWGEIEIREGSAEALTPDMFSPKGDLRQECRGLCLSGALKAAAVSLGCDLPDDCEFPAAVIVADTITPGRAETIPLNAWNTITGKNDNGLLADDEGSTRVERVRIGQGRAVAFLQSAATDTFAARWFTRYGSATGEAWRP